MLGDDALFTTNHGNDSGNWGADVLQAFAIFLATVWAARLSEVRSREAASSRF